MSGEVRQQVDFSGLVAGLATSAVEVLAQVEMLLETGKDPAGAPPGEEEAKTLPPDEVRKRVTDGLTGARQLIDTLKVLEDKTQGNLSDEEKELLQSSVSELRIRYVSLANRKVPEGAK
jgi:hypothetical protein